MPTARKPSGKTQAGAAVAETQSPRRARNYWQIAAVVMLALAALSVGLTCLWNFDLHWHLASGEWMLRNLRVLGHDPFSIDPQPRWVDVHWLFQVVITSLYKLGGFELLSVTKTAMAVAIMLIFAMALRRHVPPAWLIFSGLAMLIVVSGRIRIRPESVTLIFLMLTIVLVEDVRRGGSPRKLWWMVPVMLIWVNMHGLFILGLAVSWAAVLGAWLDKKLKRQLSGKLATQEAMVPLVAAVAACFVTPWPFEVVTHPFLLWTRVSGQSFYYTYGVGELSPTWQAVGSYKEPIVLIALVGAALLLNWRATPITHVIWLAAFMGLGLLAVRNIGLAAPVCGFLLAWHGGEVTGRLARHRPGLSRAGPWLTGLMILLAVAASAGYATELTYRLMDSRIRFGAGLQEENYPRALAKWLRDDVKVDGDVFVDNFGDSSVFEYFLAAGTNTPRRRVFMDGRLEAHSMQRFIDQNRIRHQLRTRTLADNVELPKTVRFVIVRYDGAETLAALSQSNRFRLVHLDKVGVCFEDTKWLKGRMESERPAQMLPGPNIDEFDRPLLASGLVAGMDVARRRWYRQGRGA